MHHGVAAFFSVIFFRRALVNWINFEVIKYFYHLKECKWNFKRSSNSLLSWSESMPFNSLHAFLRFDEPQKLNSLFKFQVANNFRLKIYVWIVLEYLICFDSVMPSINTYDFWQLFDCYSSFYVWYKIIFRFSFEFISIGIRYEGMNFNRNSICKHQ